MPTSAHPDEHQQQREPKKQQQQQHHQLRDNRLRAAASIISMSSCAAQLLAAVLCLAALGVAQSQQCAVGIKTPGRTVPAGDIVLEHGSPLSIHCILNHSFIEASFPGKNSSDLVFFKGQRQIEPEYITVVNDTTIRLDISEPPPENAMYYCKLRLDDSYSKDYEAVCLNKVVVGSKPQAPKGFHCVSRNWENVSCWWDPPHNYVDTIYSVTFKLPGRAGGRKLYPCPAKPKNRPRNTCYWDGTTDPIYRQPYEYYTFHLSAENVLGNWSNTYKFHHFAHVIPAKPTNLTVVNKTLDSALLHWSVSFPMQTFPPGLHHKVSYQNQWEEQDDWTTINIKDEPHLSKRYFNLTGLKYANAIYDVRVYMRSAVANSEDMWSNFSDITFRTLPRVPGQSPRMDIGSFEISENKANRDIYLYWQSIPAHLENGDNFRYQVAHVEENGRRVYLAANETTRTYAKFRGLQHHSSYNFEVVASNDVGIYEAPTKIHVPSRNYLPKEPISFTKIAFDDGLYELSWKPPSEGDEKINNYTIFWCENERDRPYQCQGYLEWVHVPKHTTVFNITVPDARKVYQFAISANTRHVSSGMIWASCTVIHNRVVGKMKTVWINRIGSTDIEVGWKLDCSDRIGIVEGYKIYYCPIISPYNLNCKGPKLNTTIEGDLNTIRGEVTELKPYKTYMIAVAVLTKNGEGQHSDPIYITTLEAPPSEPPRNVVVRNVTNTTMFVEWSEPSVMNGVLRHYNVSYDGVEKKVEEVSYVELTGLKSHYNYSISVIACTVGCSAKSKPIYVRTDIGVPDRISMPLIRFVNSSQVKVIWNNPALPAGPLDYFQIKDSDGEIQNTTIPEASLFIPDCKTIGQEKLYKFEVRAVNIAKDGEHLFGNWSDAGEGNCFSNGPSFRVWLIIWGIGGLCGIAILFCAIYSSKRLWVKCKAMQDVEVKLPPGLTPNMKLLQKSGDQHTRQSSADSSGCSSGQESVTSSLTSDSQVSTDSGADVDPVMSKKLIIDATTASTTTSSPAWESSSLRQRNVSGASKPSLDVATRWDPYVKVAKGSNELIMPTAPPADALSLARSTPNLSDNIGYAASQQTWSSTGYISMPSSEEMSSNPSPVPKENPTAGSYSVVGVLPKAPMRCKSEEETTSLTKTKTETESKPTNPYVSLVSLEQKSKDTTKKTLDSLRVFDDLGFDQSKAQPPQSAQQQSDKLSRPYVQTGFLDSSKKSPFDLRRKQQPVSQSSSFFAQSSLAEDLASKLAGPPSDSKPYVTVASIAEVTARKQPEPPTMQQQQQQPKPYVAVSSVMGGAGDAKPASSVFHMLQQQQPKGASDETVAEDQEKVGLYPSLDLDPKDDLSSASTTSSPTSTFTTLCWQGDDSSESALKSPSTELSSPTPAQPQPVKTASGYVTLPDQKPVPAKLPPARFAAKLATTTAAASSDEQYSKVTVVPHTMQHQH